MMSGAMNPMAGLIEEYGKAERGFTVKITARLD